MHQQYTQRYFYAATARQGRMGLRPTVFAHERNGKIVDLIQPRKGRPLLRDLGVDAVSEFQKQSSAVTQVTKWRALEHNLGMKRAIASATASVADAIGTAFYVVDIASIVLDSQEIGAHWKTMFGGADVSDYERVYSIAKFTSFVVSVVAFAAQTAGYVFAGLLSTAAASALTGVGVVLTAVTIVISIVIFFMDLFRKPKKVYPDPVSDYLDAVVRNVCELCGPTRASYVDDNGETRVVRVEAPSLLNGTTCEFNAAPAGSHEFPIVSTVTYNGTSEVPFNLTIAQCNAYAAPALARNGGYEGCTRPGCYVKPRSVDDRMHIRFQCP